MKIKRTCRRPKSQLKGWDKFIEALRFRSNYKIIRNLDELDGSNGVIEPCVSEEETYSKEDQSGNSRT